MATNLTAIHVGSPPAEFSLKTEESQLVHFHDFLQLPNERGEGVESPEFTCAGYQWKLIVYPAGRDTTSVEVALCSMNHEKIVVDYAICVKRAFYDRKLGYRDLASTFSTDSDPNDLITVLARKIDLVHGSTLKDGTLTLEVTIRKRDGDNNVIPQQKSSSDNLMKAFLDKDGAGVAFKVKDQIFHAHRIILEC